MLVYVIRHARAETEGPEAERALTEDGAARFREAARTYARLICEPARILTSPLRRAYQTAELLAGALGGDTKIDEIEDLLPNAPASACVARLQGELFAGTEALALVGHEPHAGNLLGLLLTGTDRAAVPLSKGMCAAVELDAPQHMIGRLQFAMSQKLARRLAASKAR